MSQDPLRCDACGSKRDVKSISGSTSDRLNVEVEMCRKCWLQWIQDYGVRASVRSRRRSFRVVDEKDIS